MWPTTAISGASLSPGRWATFKAQQRIVFGTCQESIDALMRIYTRHTAVNGELGEGAAYQANDPALLFWVYATLIDSMFYTYRTFLPELAPAEWERFYEEGKLFARLIGIPDEQVPTRLADFNAWMAEALASDDICISPLVTRSVSPCCSCRWG